MAANAPDVVANLFWEIAGCPVFRQYHAGDKADHGCAEVLAVQERNIAQAHIPEPWNGNLGASLLFLSSNPSIDVAELYPVGAPPVPNAIEFFGNRFTGISADTGARWVNDGLRVQLRKGGHAARAPQYWTEVRSAAEALLERKPDAVDWNENICLSEVVHCKSANNRGVDAATSHCTQLYLTRLLTLSGASVIVVYGKARGPVRQLLDMTAVDHHEVYLPPTMKFGRVRAMVFLPAPGSNEIRRLDGVLSNEQLEELRGLLRA